MLKLWNGEERLAVGEQPPSGGCVLKRVETAQGGFDYDAAAFGRLCVETRLLMNTDLSNYRSRLRAAVC